MKEIDSRQRKSPQVFISHANEDRAIAKLMADRLRREGLSVWFDEWQLNVGDSIVDKINRAVSTSDFIVVLLSPASVASKWVQTELNAALALELQRRAVTVLPVLIKECEIPPSLAHRQYLDLRSNLDQGIQRLTEQLGVAQEIDFSSLNYRSFENLVSDLLQTLGFSIEHQALPSDVGFDYQATILTKDPFGTQKREVWLVEVKHYRNQRVSVDAIRQMISYLTDLPNPNKGLVVTSGQLTSVAEEFLTKLTAKSRTELRVIDGNELKQLLLEHPDLVRRYFHTGRNHE